MKATLKTAISIADMFPPVYRRAIVEVISPLHLGSSISSDLHKKYFIHSIMFTGTQEGSHYWADMSLWYNDPKQHPFPPPHPSWEQRFPKEWAEYHGQLPYQF